MLFIDGGSTLLKALPKDLRHLKEGHQFPTNPEVYTSDVVENNPFFFWCPSGKPVLHAFHGKTAPSDAKNCRGQLSPLLVYPENPPSGKEEQLISHYAQAVKNVVQHPIWKVALFDILQIDQLVEPGKVWVTNQHADL